MQTETPSRRLRRAERVTFRALGADAGGVLLDLDSAHYFQLNTMGAMIWEMLAEPDGRPLAALLDELAEELVEPPDDWAELVAVFVEELLARGLLVQDHG